MAIIGQAFSGKQEFAAPKSISKILCNFTVQKFLPSNNNFQRIQIISPKEKKRLGVLLSVPYFYYKTHLGEGRKPKTMPPNNSLAHSGFLLK